jgi:hypothetical protein
MKTKMRRAQWTSASPKEEGEKSGSSTKGRKERRTEREGRVELRAMRVWHWGGWVGGYVPWASWQLEMFIICPVSGLGC